MPQGDAQTSARVPRRALVTDGEERSVVGTVRALAAAGWDVGVVASGRPAAAQWSRGCAQRLRCVDSRADPRRFVAELAAAARTGGYDVLLPGSDAALLAISAHRDLLDGPLRHGIPPHDAVVACLDKSRLAEAATAAGLATPRSVVCGDLADARAATEALGLPVVVKPIRSLVMRGGVVHAQGGRRADDEAEVAELVAACGTPCLVQAREPGPIVSCSGVMIAGRLRAVATSRYERTWPPVSGNAAFAVTIAPPDGLPGRVERLLAELGWEGIFELELIERPDGELIAIDLNPRVFGSISLVVAAGAALPAIWCAALIDERVDQAAARPGVRYRWEDGDLRHALWQLRRGAGRAALAAAAPHRRVVHAHVRADDPLPLVARAVYLAGSRLRRPRVVPTTPEPGALMPSDSVVVVGAGPYGLAAAAHLRAAGLPAHVLGEPMESWSRNMPAGMLLRSGPRASHLSDPRRRSTLEAFAADRGAPVPDPIPVEDFVEYGRWFAERELGDVDPRRAKRISADGDGRFEVELDDGEVLDAGRVVVAAGLAPFTRRPEPFADLPPELVSHAWDHADLAVFAGRRVAVVGGGQSALESAALLNEGGADVELLTPRPIYWLADKTLPRTLKDRAHPPTEVGGIFTGWVAAVPDVYRRLPESRRPAIAAGCLRPAGAFWLRARLAGVPMIAGRRVTGATAAPGGGGVDLVLDDGSQRHADHVLLGTGYHVDVARYPFLDPDLVARIERSDGSPVLRRGLETSVSGLHMLGAASARSFGPIMRFVTGSWYAAPALARHAAGRRPAPLARAFA